jgi:dsDNA-binding SOS-regulon protein
MVNDEPIVTLFEAGTAADRLGVSASGLRRLSLIYEEVYEGLPRKPKSNNRLWPEDAVIRLQAARMLLQTEKYRTIQEALVAIKNGLVDEAEIEAPQIISEPTQQALEVFIAELRDLREELAATREQNMTLQNQLSKSLVSLEETEAESVAVRLARRFDRLMGQLFNR